jgi:hypothetical protein
MPQMPQFQESGTSEWRTRGCRVGRVSILVELVEQMMKYLQNWFMILKYLQIKISYDIIRYPSSSDFVFLEWMFRIPGLSAYGLPDAAKVGSGKRSCSW